MPQRKVMISFFRSVRVKPGQIKAVSILPGAVYFCILIVSACGIGDIKKEPEPMPVISDFTGYDFSQIRNGDIVIKRGNGMVSAMIARRLKEKVPLSHCGIIVKTQDSISVIHSVSKEITGVDGVQAVGFRKFTEDCVKGLFYIVRIKSDRALTDPTLAEHAKHYLDKAIPFDYELNYTDPSRMNCSELIYWSLLNVTGKDLFTRINIDNQKALAFNSLLDTSNFSIVYHY